MRTVFSVLKRHRLAVAVLLVSAAVPIALALLGTVASDRTPRIVFLDVGQGDSTLILGGDGEEALVDGGPDASVLSGLGRRMPSGDREIELLVLTHPHADHVTGLVEVLRRYKVDRVLMTGVVPQSPAGEEFGREVAELGIPVEYAVAGESFSVGAFRLETLWPREPLAGTTVDDRGAAAEGGMNDTSIVLRATAASSTALLMADASVRVESELVGSGADLKADLLKAGHHGSGGSSSREFLAAVGARFAAISAGAGNRYGLPALKTVLRLADSGAEVFRTDRDGDIVAAFGPSGVSVTAAGK